MSRMFKPRKSREPAGRGVMREPAISKEKLLQHLAVDFPQVFNDKIGISIDDLGYGRARVRQVFRKHILRPGGTISGPTMMALVDVAMYIALLGAIGWVPGAVTTQLNINFLRRPEAKDIIADGKMLKIGKRLAVGEVSIYSEGSDEVVAHATCTYAIPQKAGGPPKA
ncbi:MAG TPA: PaaI family thioesterase [Bradyrhizobium sp.]|nr:PaaI family thioesterase [Bradyrhizobium sp.]